MIQLYGIPNCDTVKKARVWLEENQIQFEFIDFKKRPPTLEELEQWLKDIPLSVLLNKRGTTWRKLTPEEQSHAEQEPLPLMCAMPSLIKRPVLVVQGRAYCGFKPEEYAQIFGK